MRVIYLTKEPYPGPGAAAIRLGLICKGLKESNIPNLVFSIYSGISRKNVLYKIFRLFHRYFLLFKQILKIKSDDRIIIYGPWSNLFSILVLRLKGCKIVFERTEYPSYLISSNKFKRIEKLKAILFLKNLRFASAFITCSEALRAYYSKHTSSNTNFLLLPLIIDYGKFSQPGVKLKPQIVYCGNMGNNKDGVPILIEAFKMISNKFPNFQLVLIGSAEPEVMDKLTSHVKKNNLSNRIIFTGKVAHHEMPVLLNQASVLALARPNNKQAEGGFPSKLGEYLSTGRPVVVTNVGEIDHYIKDGVNGYISNSDSVDEFASKLDFVLSNYEQARKVGLKGKEIAEKFDYVKQSKLLIEFLQNV